MLTDTHFVELWMAYRQGLAGKKTEIMRLDSINPAELLHCLGKPLVSDHLSIPAFPESQDLRQFSRQHRTMPARHAAAQQKAAGRTRRP
jgi:hypothetical protein